VPVSRTELANIAGLGALVVLVGAVLVGTVNQRRRRYRRRHGFDRKDRHRFHHHR
jgi:hypothetical protein